MTDTHHHCRRCGRPLQAAPAELHDRVWSDPRRVAAQGWVGPTPQDAVGLECLTPDEANFLLPARPGQRDGSGRFTRDAVPDRLAA